jgi:hypothetical protein
MEEDYDNENVMENIDDDEEEMMNENLKNGKEGESKLNGEKIGPPNITLKPPGTKQKRRSKNDCNGRDYVCGCGKTYLSYPALYTHIKTKHNGKTPDGTNANQIQNGKGRGRPRKNFLINEELIRRQERHEGLEERNLELKEIYNKKENLHEYASSKEHIYSTIFNSLGLAGHVRDPLAIFPKFVEDKILMDKKNSGYYILYEKVKNYLSTHGKLLLYNNHHKNEEKENQFFLNLEKDNLSCDDIFAIFILDISRTLSLKFLKNLLIFIKNLRDCMNIIGWEILSEYKSLRYEPTILDFTSVKNAECLPDLSNEFINIFLPNKLPNWDKHLAVVIVNMICDWLYKHKFTNKKLSLL